MCLHSLTHVDRSWKGRPVSLCGDLLAGAAWIFIRSPLNVPSWSVRAAETGLAGSLRPHADWLLWLFWGLCRPCGSSCVSCCFTQVWVQICVEDHHREPNTHKTTYTGAEQALILIWAPFPPTFPIISITWKLFPLRGKIGMVYVTQPLKDLSDLLLVLQVSYI